MNADTNDLLLINSSKPWQVSWHSVLNCNFRFQTRFLRLVKRVFCVTEIIRPYASRTGLTGSLGTTGTLKDLVPWRFHFLVPTWYRSTGSFDNLWPLCFPSFCIFQLSNKPLTSDIIWQISHMISHVSSGSNQSYGMSLSYVAFRSPIYFNKSACSDDSHHFLYLAKCCGFINCVFYSLIVVFNIYLKCICSSVMPTSSPFIKKKKIVNTVV